MLTAHGAVVAALVFPIMDIYTFSLALGGVGLGIMALGGVGHQSHDGHGHASHGHGSHGHDAGAHHASHHAAHDLTQHGAPVSSSLVWTLGMPRIAFSILLGLGAAGVLLRGVLAGPALFALSLVAGVALERLALTPLMNFLFRFTSTPALTLDSTLLDEAHATSGFDANGEGLVALQLDGQIVQVLGSLRSEDRALGVRVRAGDRLRVEEVDGERHRCTVSFIGRP